MGHHGPRFEALVDDAKRAVREITIPELRDRIVGGTAPAIIDTREDREFAAGRIPGAVHLGKGVIERDIEQAYPALDTELVLYCGGGYRSALAAKALQDMGYVNVWSLAGGRRGWQEASLPWDTDPR